MEKKSKELEIAIEAARAAGAVLEKYFQTELSKEYKSDNSLVTQVDRESEEVIKKIILENFPDHSIFGEETGMTENKGEYIWHIDPLDGTTNFSRGVPLFAVSIALEYKNKIIVGVIYKPVIKDLFYAEIGKGAYVNDKKISVSKDDEKNSMITVSGGRKKENKILARNLRYHLPEKIRGIRLFGSAATELSYVARGGMAANIELGLDTYDFAAGTILVMEAGGKITGLDGGEWKFPNNFFIASNGVFHDLLVEEVQKEKTKLEVN